MTTGHYAPALLLKRRFPETPLWQLFLGVQALDVLFFVLVPLGVERVALDPTARMPLAMDLQYMPYSHSLLAATAYGGLAWAIGRVAGRPSIGLALGAAIASHWLCDVLVHLPDMPLWSGDGVRVGFALWRWTLTGVVVELGFLAIAYTGLRGHLGAAARRAGDLTVTFLCVVQVLNDFVLPTPASAGQLAISAQLLFATAAWFAGRVDHAG